MLLNSAFLRCTAPNNRDEEMALAECYVNVNTLPYTATTKYGAALGRGRRWGANRYPNRVTIALYQFSGGRLRSTYTVRQKYIWIQTLTRPHAIIREKPKHNRKAPTDKLQPILETQSILCIIVTELTTVHSLPRVHWLAPTHCVRKQRSRCFRVTSAGGSNVSAKRLPSRH